MDKSIGMLQCNICKGEYYDRCADGLDYYHVCPDLVNANGDFVEREFKRDENAGMMLEGNGVIEVDSI